MSIFRREDEPRPHSPAAPPQGHSAAASERRPSAPSASTHIAPGAKVVGEIQGTCDLVVDGEIEGQVRLQSHVSIGAEGRVKGDIHARTVRIGGRVVGNVHGDEKVEILPSGRLEGDVSAPRVVLAEGAFFKGKVEMTGGSGKPAPGSRESAPREPAREPAPPAAAKAPEVGA